MIQENSTNTEFETVNLEKVKDKIIDIQQAGLLVTGTFVENIPGIFREGLKENAENAVVGYNGSLNNKALKRRDGGDFIYLEETTRNGFAEGKLTWSGIYDTYVILSENAKNFVIQDPKLPDWHRKAKAIPREEIIGLVIDREVGKLFQSNMNQKFLGSDYANQWNNGREKKFPLNSTGRRGEVNYITTTVFDIVLTFEELLEQVKKNMFIGIGLDLDYRVPIYDNNGVLLWPIVKQ